MQNSQDFQYKTPKIFNSPPKEGSLLVEDHAGLGEFQEDVDAERQLLCIRGGVESEQGFLPGAAFLVGRVFHEGEDAALGLAAAGFDGFHARVTQILLVHVARLRHFQSDAGAGLERGIVHRTHVLHK
jgi:hypothetical protein